MARKYKSRVTTEKLDAKIEQQKETLEKAKARYEAEKDALAELVKMRNELRKEELMVSAKYSCGFSNTLISSIIVGERYLDYFTTITEDRL